MCSSDLVLMSLIRKAIEQYLNRELYDAWLEREKTEREALTKLASQIKP